MFCGVYFGADVLISFSEKNKFKTILHYLVFTINFLNSIQAHFYFLFACTFVVLTDGSKHGRGFIQTEHKITYCIQYDLVTCKYLRAPRECLEGTRIAVLHRFHASTPCILLSMGKFVCPLYSYIAELRILRFTYVNK